MNVKKLVSQNQQAEIEFKNNLEAVCDAMLKQAESRLKPARHSKMSSLAKRKSSMGADDTYKRDKGRRVRDADSPIRKTKTKIEATPVARSPTHMSRRSGGSMGLQSPMGSHRSNQLRLDLIDEEERIDEMLQGTHNFWTKDVERHEETYDRQELMGLEDEKLDLIAQCA